MNVAVIGNIDGQVEALALALAQIEEEGIVTILQTGNVALGAGGHEAIRLLREAQATCVQGETDRRLAQLERKRARMARELGDDFPAYEAALAGLRAADVEWLGTLHDTRTLDCDGAAVLLSHGMPDDHRDYFERATPSHRLQRARESASAQAVASGGAVAYYTCHVGDTLLLNAPSLVAHGTVQWVRLLVHPGTASAELVTSPWGT